MAIETWLTAKAIKAIYDTLEKNPIRIKGVAGEERELVIWVSQGKGSPKKSLKKN